MAGATIKFNSGMLALLCSRCSTILKTGREFNDHEIMYAQGRRHLEAQFCLSCKIENVFNENNKKMGKTLSKDFLNENKISDDLIEEAIKKEYIREASPGMYKMFKNASSTHKK